MENKSVYYSSYLQLDKILGAQDLESDKANDHAHDEMLFIVIHQAYELWFKQVLYEVGSVNEILSQQSIQDNAPDLYTINHRLKRTVTILNLLIDQIGVMETMTPLDFLDFRNRLRPASGFQSIQFKLLEAALGLKMADRHGQQYYLSQLTESDRKIIVDAEEKVGLIDLINNWLERMPFFDEAKYWISDSSQSTTDLKDVKNHPFWIDYAKAYEGSLQEIEKFNLTRFEERLMASENKEAARLSPRSRRAALFIMLYRDYPLLQLPFTLLSMLLEIDECLATWRYRHVSMVHRIIGMRSGTGGSSGAGYLKGALEKHHVFGEFGELTSFLIERNKLPKLNGQLQAKLGFEN